MCKNFLSFKCINTIDQLTKSLIIYIKESVQSYKLRLFNLDYVKNYGAAFNI